MKRLGLLAALALLLALCQSVYGRGALVDKSSWGLVLLTDAIGGPAIGQTEGGYTGLTFRSSNHSGGGMAPYIIKGWIFKP